MALIQEQRVDGYRFVVRPNCALSWRMTKYLIWFFAACLFVVGAYFASLGAWFVLPFAGLEFAVVAAGFYFCALAGHTREVIEVQGPVLRVLRGGQRLEEVASFPANWTRVVLQRDPTGWYPSRLLLRCHGKGLELGNRIVESEREELAAQLRELLDFSLLDPDRSDRDQGSERRGLPTDMGLGARAPFDPDPHAMIGTCLAVNRAGAVGCARGALTEEREDLWQ